MLRMLTAIAVTVSACSLTLAGDIPGLVTEKPATGRSVKVDGGYMVPYEMKIPGTDVTFAMEPIPGGEFMMGSPDSEPGREDIEGPQRKFKVEPFWMGRTEVRLDQYKQYMDLYEAFKQFEVQGIRQVSEENAVDAITAPTPLYDPTFTFEFGEDPAQPAITVSQYAAKQYTKWLSALTGNQYRLPTEAEWEYACRAGSQTAYHFGDDPAQLGDYAWYAGNTDDSGTRLVAQKKPNAWGLYDMHGNAAEWVLDQYADYEPADQTLNATSDWAQPESLDPRVVRGGSWEFEAAECRSASRFPTDHEAWRTTDPNFPKSPWWFTDDPARGVGFRILRPLKPLNRAEIEQFWRIDDEETEFEVDSRLGEGRGVRGLVDEELPKAIDQLNAEE